MAEEENAVEEGAAPKAGGMARKLIFGVVVILAVAGGAFAAVTFMKPGESAPADETEVAVEAAGSPKAAIYTSLQPPLLVNLTDTVGSSHFMQVTMEVMAREQDVINAVRDNAPIVRNSLILLYSGENYEDVVTREGKEKMLADGLAEIKKVMKQESGVSGIEAIYFTNLVIQ